MPKANNGVLSALPNSVGDVAGIAQAEQYLRDGVTLASLREIARHMSDTQAARQMQQAKQTLFIEMRPRA